MDNMPFYMRRWEWQEGLMESSIAVGEALILLGLLFINCYPAATAKWRRQTVHCCISQLSRKCHIHYVMRVFSIMLNLICKHFFASLHGSEIDLAHVTCRKSPWAAVSIGSSILSSMMECNGSFALLERTMTSMKRRPELYLPVKQQHSNLSERIALFRFQRSFPTGLFPLFFPHPSLAFIYWLQLAVPNQMRSECLSFLWAKLKAPLLAGAFGKLIVM